MCDLDEVMRALADRKRRYVVECLLEHRRVTLADLAEFVVERETGESVAAVSAERVREVYFSLYHTHVPILEAADLARYDQAQDLVACAPKVQRSLRRVCETVNGLVSEA